VLTYQRNARLCAVLIHVVLIFCFTSAIVPDRLYAFGLGGKDYRIPLKWIADPGAKGAIPAMVPGDYGRKIKTGGRERFYEIHVPRSYDKSKPTPVVLGFHGGGGYPGAVRHQSGMDKVSDREGFLVVYPAGTGRLFDDRLLVWNDGRPAKDSSANKVDDVAFVAALLDDLAKFFNVDAKRVYSTGISNGALMSYRLAQQLSDRIAAIGPVSGQRAVNEFFQAPPRCVPIIHFHGKEDNYAPFEGGEPARSNFKAGFKPVAEALGSWIAHNGCSYQSAATKRVGKALETAYKKCRNDCEVVLWTLEDGGHAWPGGQMSPAEVKAKMGKINQDISASSLMWEFFKKHHL
jgi:polyhydroxybutyrate depolymerase